MAIKELTAYELKFLKSAAECHFKRPVNFDNGVVREPTAYHGGKFDSGYYGIDYDGYPYVSDSTGDEDKLIARIKR